MPDPSAVLAAAVEQINSLQKAVELLEARNSSLEKQNQQKPAPVPASSGMSKMEHEELLQLRQEVAEYEVEFRSLKNQDITIRKLEARIQELQQGGKEEFESRLEQAMHELADTEGRRTAEALEREAAMERKVQSLELQLKAEMAGRVATQAHLLEASEGAGEREAAWEAQRRILVDDSERLRVNLHQASRERDDLRLKVAALEGNNPVQAPSSGVIAMADLLSERTAYEAEVSELSLTVNSLREEIALKDEAIADQKRTLDARIEDLERDLSSLKTNLGLLETQLAAAPSQSLVESMKRELRILKRLEYNADDPDFDIRDPEMTGGLEDQEKDLESVLVAKLRRVETELVKERNVLSVLKKEMTQLQEQFSQLEMAKKEADKIVASLERDLDKAISSSSTPVKTLKKKRVPVLTETGTLDLEHVLDPDAPVPKPVPPQENASMSAAEKAADDHSVATIIMAQRDRLRARCDALEAERDSFKRELQVQVEAGESLKTDNTKLFEKLRYLQSYNNRPGSTGAYNRSNSRDLDLEALEQRYEASVDPFKQFGKAERQRKLKEMSPMERTVFVVAKTVLGTKEMRTFLFFYVLALHTLVFSTTYHWSHSTSGCGIAVSEHLSHLPPMTDKTPEQVLEDLGGAKSS
jgi:homeobox protein cut-like